jgi:dTDP-4-dehydrorhamnose 3,5-epimerase
MKIVEVGSLAIPEIRVIRFARFRDPRGYFTEHYRRGDLRSDPRLHFLADIDWVQANESRSRRGTVRGLHFQWNPYMGKLVRTIVGRMFDLVLDIRKGSPTFGKIIVHDMPANPDDEAGEWIWVPPGFAHGNFFLTDTVIEYFCSGEYSPSCEAGISPLAGDLDWSLCQPDLKTAFDEIVASGPLISDKDRGGRSLAAWESDPNSESFLYNVNG